MKLGKSIKDIVRIPLKNLVYPELWNATLSVSKSSLWEDLAIIFWDNNGIVELLRNKNTML